MKLTSFVRGMALGMVAGVALDMMTAPYGVGHTAAGRAARKAGCVVGKTIDDVADKLQ